MNMSKGKCILCEGKFFDKKMMLDIDRFYCFSFILMWICILYGEEGSRGKGEW